MMIRSAIHKIDCSCHAKVIHVSEDDEYVYEDHDDDDDEDEEKNRWRRWRRSRRRRWM